MLVYGSDPKEAIRECLQLKNTFSKMTGYKITFKKSALLYTNNNQAKKEIRKRILRLLHEAKAIPNTANVAKNLILGRSWA